MTTLAGQGLNPVLAIVGSTKFVNEYGEPLAKKIINTMINVYQPRLIVSGGAPGVDTWARCAARERRGQAIREFLPRNKRWAPHGFQERNILIAEACDVLVCIRCAGSKTYGSGWTADYAKKLGREVQWFAIPIEGV